jgi:hypothetical protein
MKTLTYYLEQVQLPKTLRDLEKEGYEDLGMNVRSDNPIIKKCKEANHKRRFLRLGPPNTGDEDYTICDIDKYYFQHHPTR